MLEEVKTTAKNKEFQGQGEAASKLIESFFMISNDSLRDIHTSAVIGQSDAESSVLTSANHHPSVVHKDAELFIDLTNKGTASAMKRRKLNIEVVQSSKGVGYESAGEEGTLIGKRNLMNQTGLMSKKQKKQADKTVASKLTPTPRKSEKKRAVE